MVAPSFKNYDVEIGVYRPPSEGGSDSLLLRVTRNCPWNRCEFCAMYKTETFELRSPDEVKADIDTVAAMVGELRDVSMELGLGGAISAQVAAKMLERRPALNYHHGFVMVFNWIVSGGRTVFLQDANSLIMKTEQLVGILQHLRKTFPSIERVTSYARSKTLAQKKQAELTAICRAGLDRVHVGLESGDDALLKRIKKGVTSEGHIKGGKKAMAAGFQLSEYWMPGLGGKAMWQDHAVHTADVLNAIDPHYIRSRPFFPAPGTPLYLQYEAGEFQPLSPVEQLHELQLMVEGLKVTSKVCFDHAGNWWRNRRGGLLFSQSYEGYQFPKEKETVLALINEGLTAN